MSDYKRITRHPTTGKYQIAQWKDDYFGKHRYGVQFGNEIIVYPADQVAEAQLKEFWVDDVLVAFRVYLEQLDDIAPDMMDDELVRFLSNLQAAYEARWERDPINAEGAVNHYLTKYGRHLHEETTD